MPGAVRPGRLVPASGRPTPGRQDRSHADCFGFRYSGHQPVASVRLPPAASFVLFQYICGRIEQQLRTYERHPQVLRDPGGQRPRPRHAAARRRAVGPGRDAARPRAGPTSPVSSDWWAPRCRPRAPRSADRCCSAARPCRRRSWCTSCPRAPGNPTTERGTSRPRADCRAGAPAPRRSRSGGHDPAADARGDPGGGLAGRRQERARHRRGDGARGTDHHIAQATGHAERTITSPRRRGTRNGPSTGT